MPPKSKGFGIFLSLIGIFIVIALVQDMAKPLFVDAKTSIYPVTMPSGEPVISKYMEVNYTSDGVLVLEEDLFLGGPTSEETRWYEKAGKYTTEKYRRDRLIIGTYESERMLFALRVTGQTLPKSGHWVKVEIFENACTIIRFSGVIFSQKEQYSNAVCSDLCGCDYNESSEPFVGVGEGLMIDILNMVISGE